MTGPTLVADGKKRRSSEMNWQGFWASRVGRLCRNIVGSGAARGINLLISLAQVPLTINSLGREDYAFLAMAISISALSAYADLGMGLAVVNTIAGEAHKSKSRRSRRAVSVVWFTLLGIAASGIVVAGGLSFLMAYVANANDALRYRAILLGAGCVFVGLPTGLVQRVLFAQHRASEANFWATGGRFLSLGVVWALVESGLSSLANLVFAVVGVPALIGWMSVLFVFNGKGARGLKPRQRFYDRRLLKPYLVLGVSFLVMQLVPYAEVGIDTILAGTTLGVQVVPVLDVYTRLFTYVPALLSIALFPLWPAITSAKAQGDICWITKIQRSAYTLVSILSCLASTLLVVYGEDIVSLWTHQRMSIPTETIVGMGLFAVLTCVGTVQSMVMNGIGLIGQQAILFAVYALLVVFAKFLSALAFGWTGMVWALNFCYVARLLLARILMQKQLGSR